MSTEMSLNTAYENLGLNQPASLADVKSRRNWLALLCHPDKNPGRVDEASVRMAAINEAFATVVCAIQAQEESNTSALTFSTRNYTTRSSSVKTASSTAQSDTDKENHKINLLSALKSIGSCIYKVGRLAEVTAGKPRKEDALCQVFSRLQRLTFANLSWWAWT